MKNSPPAELPAPPSPLAGAFAVSASMFVAATAIFVAVLAFVTGAHQLDSVGLAQSDRQPNEAARWWSYAVGVAILLDGLYAGARARKSPRTAVVTTVIFVILSIATGWLYVNTW